jgi:thiol-disulfide isomerase/thioredoxin
MNRFLLAAAAFCWLYSSALAEPPRSAETILKEYNAVKEPELDRTKARDAAYVRTYVAQQAQAIEKKNALALELYQADPKHPEAGKLMLARWENLAGTDGAKANAEMAKFLKDNPASPLKADILFQRAVAALRGGEAGPAQAATDEFLAAAPKDERGAGLLYFAASQLEDEKEQLKLYRRIVAEYPNSKAAMGAAGSVRQADDIGKPFELAFEDAVSGKQVSIKGLQGKVVVVDFWATWCGPCVAEMPTMKKLYAEHKDHGVEFVGVSLDSADGGLDALKAFVKEREIPWPQYFQGNGWESKFSTSWGITGIPCVFVVDADGNLYSTKARGNLETLIPELIKKRGEKKQ